MWAKLNSARNAIEEIIVNAKEITVNGIKHPKALFTLWTDAERKAIGILPVTEASHLDSEYYVENSPSYAIEGDGNSVTETITKSADNTLSIVKSSQLLTTKNKCNILLAPTDWYVVRKAETSTAIPAKITAFRTAVRTIYAAAKSAINGAANIDALKVVNTNGTGATASITVNGTSTGVVSASNNTITKNGHGFVDDECLNYDDGQDDADNPIKGLVSREKYYVHTATTNTFKLSLTPSVYGDEAVVSLTGVADAGTAHTFTSVGILKTMNDWPTENHLAYRL
jgi:hypothetical protein|tara:strand:+ start:1226 stop:2077 length:852 start_codon:yes stop_codon:yes gene_type:complete